MSAKDDDKTLDLFELATALLLGLAAIGSAFAALQAGQWGGKQLESFSEANTMTTKAAKEYNEQISTMSSDYSAIAQAKKLILEGVDAREEADQLRSYQLASYFYTEQLTETAYKTMGLPKELLEKAPGGDKGKRVTEEEIEANLRTAIDEETLLASLDYELHGEESDYFDVMFAQADKMFADADKRFGDGRAANDNGDKFDLVGLYYTIALFFAGLGLVFKTRVRWGFFSTGSLAFLGSTAYMLTLNWPG
jgi:hypothetical protein